MDRKLQKIFFRLTRRLFTGMFIVSLGFGSPALCRAKEELAKCENARCDGDFSARKGSKETKERF